MDIHILIGVWCLFGTVFRCTWVFNWTRSHSFSFNVRHKKKKNRKQALSIYYNIYINWYQKHRKLLFPVSYTEDNCAQTYTVTCIKKTPACDHHHVHFNSRLAYIKWPPSFKGDSYSVPWLAAQGMLDCTRFMKLLKMFSKYCMYSPCIFLYDQKWVSSANIN